MKIQIFSDLHLEFGRYDAKIASDVDVVVFAGDIDVQQRSIRWLETLYKQCRNRPYFLYICGNHEFYGQIFPSVIRSLKYKIKNHKIVLLENESITINNVKFIGSTLWTNFTLFDDIELSKQVVLHAMNDYRKITFYQHTNNPLRTLHPMDIAKYHEESLMYIKQELQKSTQSKIVLISHHAPSIESVPEDSRENPIYAAYANRLENLCQEQSDAVTPDIWIHGHIHKSQDYYINQTHVIANPRGYAGYRVNPEFKDQYVLEI